MIKNQCTILFLFLKKHIKAVSYTHLDVYKRQVLNCGSSSIKYKLFDMTSGEVMAQGGIEKIGLPGAFLKLTDKDGCLLYTSTLPL